MSGYSSKFQPLGQVRNWYGVMEWKLINRDDRSPWSNEYDPPLEDGTLPSAKLRKMEVQANEAFDTYREM